MQETDTQVILEEARIIVQLLHLILIYYLQKVKIIQKDKEEPKRYHFSHTESTQMHSYQNK